MAIPASNLPESKTSKNLKKYGYGDLPVIPGILSEQESSDATTQLASAKQGDLESVGDFKERVRQQGINAAQGAAQRSEESFQSLKGLQDKYGSTVAGAAAAQQAAGAAGLTSARQQAAAGLRAGAATGGMGGAGAAQLRTTSLNQGAQLGQMQGETAKQVAATQMLGAQNMYGLGEKTGQAGVESKVQSLEAAKFEKEAGTKATDYQQKIRDYGPQIEKIKAAHKGGLGGMLPDDEEGAGDEIETMALAEEDPQVQKWLYSQAKAARTEI